MTRTGERPADGGGPVVRPAERSDLEVIRTVERRAGQAFVDVGLSAIADDEPMSIADLEGHRRAGRLWVVAEPGGPAVGFAATSIVDGCCHLDEMSVDPAFQGRGLGRALLDRVAEYAASEGFSAVTLTTFADVPWNRPLYEHCGFRVLAADEIGPGLGGLRATEAARGLDPRRRVCMRRDV